MKSVLKRLVAGCLFVCPAIVPATESGSSEELITLSPFIVETGQYQSQFKGSGLIGLRSEAPFELLGTLDNQLDWVLGVSLQSRGLHSVEPTIQGMGFDRIVTTLDGIYLPNASPTHTASPLNFFSSNGQLSLDVLRSLPSVSLGPVPTGSRILVETVDPAEAGVFMRFSGDDEKGRSGSLTIQEKLEGNPFNLGLHYQENDDYKGGGPGPVVDSDYKAWGIQFNGVMASSRSHRTTFSANYFRQALSRNASLPLDTKDTSSLTIALSHSISLEQGVLSLRAGYTQTDPCLTSEDRIVDTGAPIALVDANGKVRSYTIGGDWKSRDLHAIQIHAGMDCTWQSRNMLRRRHLKSGAVFEDLIWPDIESCQAGAFTEVSDSGSGPVHWRLGARLDRHSSRSNAPDQSVQGVPGARGKTIRENFVSFHGPGAETVDARDWTGAANGLLELELTERIVVHSGIGYTVATAGLGEQYRSFVNALGGGVEIGNPTLKRERKREVHAGLSYTGKRFQASAATYFMEVDDFVGREIISTDPLIYSFKNKDAQFTGIHAALEIQLLQALPDGKPAGGNKEAGLMRVSLPVSFSVTRGEDARTGKRLPEIPPLEADVGLRFSGRLLPFKTTQELTLVCRHVAAKDNPQPDLNPVFHDSRAYTLVDVELLMEWTTGWIVALRIDNVFDREAYSYLQPPVATGPIAPSSGSLSGGDRIPLRGRHVLLTLGFDF